MNYIPNEFYNDRVAEFLKANIPDICTSSYEGSHIVLDVEPGGKNYTINYITASDESMTVRSVLKFKTKG